MLVIHEEIFGKIFGKIFKSYQNKCFTKNLSVYSILSLEKKSYEKSCQKSYQKSYQKIAWKKVCCLQQTFQNLIKFW